MQRLPGYVPFGDPSSRDAAFRAAVDASRTKSLGSQNTRKAKVIRVTKSYADKWHSWITGPPEGAMYTCHYELIPAANKTNAANEGAWLPARHGDGTALDHLYPQASGFVTNAQPPPQVGGIIDISYVDPNLQCETVGGANVATVYESNSAQHDTARIKGVAPAGKTTENTKDNIKKVDCEEELVFDVSPRLSAIMENLTDEQRADPDVINASRNMANRQAIATYRRTGREGVITDQSEGPDNPNVSDQGAPIQPISCNKLYSISDLASPTQTIIGRTMGRLSGKVFPRFPLGTIEDVSARVTSRFGTRPIPKGLSARDGLPSVTKKEGHNGIDFACVVNTPIVSALPGVVAEVGYQPRGAGHYIYIKHPDYGNIWTLYAHLSRPPLLSKEDPVGYGTSVGLSGNSGRSTGPHLHFGVRVGRRGSYIDPEVFLKTKFKKTGDM